MIRHGREKKKTRRKTSRGLTPEIPLVALCPSGELTFTFDTFSALGSPLSYLASAPPFPQFADPPLLKSHPNSSASFQKDRILGGAPLPDRGGIPVPSGGLASAARFLAIFPFSRAAVGWAACRASGRLVRGRPRRAARARTARRIAASPASDQVRFLGKGWILGAFVVGNGP